MTFSKHISESVRWHVVVLTIFMDSRQLVNIKIEFKAQNQRAINVVSEMVHWFKAIIYKLIIAAS